MFVKKYDFTKFQLDIEHKQDEVDNLLGRVMQQIDFLAHKLDNVECGIEALMRQNGELQDAYVDLSSKFLEMCHSHPEICPHDFGWEGSIHRQDGSVEATYRCNLCGHREVQMG